MVKLDCNFRELRDARRANGMEIFTIEGGDTREHLYTVDTVCRDFSGHFDKHFKAGRKKWYRRSEVHPLFRMDDHGKACREGVLHGTTDPSQLPKDLRGSSQALQTKKINGVALSTDLYTCMVTTAAGDIIPITPTDDPPAYNCYFVDFVGTRKFIY